MWEGGYDARGHHICMPQRRKLCCCNIFTQRVSVLVGRATQIPGAALTLWQIAVGMDRGMKYVCGAFLNLRPDQIRGGNEVEAVRRKHLFQFK